jgi:hypothetical protein
MGNQTGKTSHKERDRLLVLGSDTADTSSIISHFKLDNAVEVSKGNVMIWNKSIRTTSRVLRRFHFDPQLKALLFVVDSVDNEEIIDARNFLQSILMVDEWNHEEILSVIF